jgi:UDPglucose--hexose-1-phosphate uridylyltransferase
MRPELRKDYVQDKYVIIAPGRAKRLKDESVPACVFCPPQLDREKAILALEGKKGDWRLKVVPNKFPAVSMDNPKAYGVQEIVVETPEHNVHLEDLSEECIAAIFDVYASRTEVLSKNPRIEYILIFKNGGGKAGASITHAHSQIFSTNFIPPHLLDKSEKVFEYKLKHGSCVYCDVIVTERISPRFVYEDGEVIAFTPYASMHNYEIWILPKRHFDNITDANTAEKRSWASVLKKCLNAITKLGLPYNYYFHQVIQDRDQHLYMKITPRGSTWAGVEIGSGIIINPVSPEAAAEYYRNAMQ